jgi:hypothetical protein
MAGDRVTGMVKKYSSDPHWHDLVLFHEYFHGETGLGLGASHQTGWTALTAKLLENAVENPAGVADAKGDGITAIPRATGAKLAGLIGRTLVPV